MEHSTPSDWMVAMVFHLFLFGLSWLVIIRPLGSILKWEPPEFDQSMMIHEKKNHEDDYWEEEVDYGTGEIITNTGPTIRHPKNRDRAYEGSVERFHDGGW